MTDRDYDNLKFLLHASEDELERWYNAMSDDDIRYAQTLLEVAKAEVIDQAVDLMSEMKDATSILNQFTKTK